MLHRTELTAGIAMGDILLLRIKAAAVVVNTEGMKAGVAFIDFHISSVLVNRGSASWAHWPVMRVYCHARVSFPRVGDVLMVQR